MALPLTVLAVNLLWPRLHTVKISALFVLVLSTWFHASPLAGMNPHHRALGVVEREISGEGAINVKRSISELRWARAVAARVLFDVCLSLTLAVVFALVRPNSLARIWARFFRGAVRAKIQSKRRAD